MTSQLIFVGDSLSEGSEPTALPGNFSFPQGGKGAWWELVIEWLSNISNLGPRVSSGFRGVWLGDGTVSYASSWSTPTGADLFDKCPYGLGKYSANGTAAIVTFTRPSFRPVVGIKYYYIDLNRTSGTQGGEGSYSKDSGSYTALGQTILNDNAVKSVYISGVITTDFKVRAATAGGTAVAIFPIGVEWFYAAPGSDGLIGHQLAANGMLLRDLVGGAGNTTVGDRMALFDLISPNKGIVMMHGRDVTLDNTTQWATDLTTFEARADNYGSVYFMNHFELAEYPTQPNSISPGYPFDDQTSYRNQLKTTADSLGVPYLDLFDDWKSFGLGGQGAQNTAARAIGFIYSLDNGHILRKGHDDIARRVYAWLKPYLSSIDAPKYTSKGKVPTLAAKSSGPGYVGKGVLPLSPGNI